VKEGGGEEGERERERALGVRLRHRGRGGRGSHGLIKPPRLLPVPGPLELWSFILPARSRFEKRLIHPCFPGSYRALVTVYSFIAE
jgi:hypothetical protein